VYVSTLGNPLVDYIVADTIVAPHEVATHMSGKMLHLPHTFFPTSHRWLYPLDLPLFGLDPSFDVSRVDLGLPYRRPPSSHFKADAANSSSSNKSNTVTSATSDAAFVFACFNKHLKIRSELFACWCSVLRRLPNAKLWLLEYPKESQAQLRQVIAVLFLMCGYASFHIVLLIYTPAHTMLV
jgi:predicted O-linked N-acetylglucosamine transferase (SPINDLY family)